MRPPSTHPPGPADQGRPSQGARTKTGRIQQQDINAPRESSKDGCKWAMPRLLAYIGINSRRSELCVFHNRGALVRKRPSRACQIRLARSARTHVDESGNSLEHSASLANFRGLQRPRGKQYGGHRFQLVANPAILPATRRPRVRHPPKARVRWGRERLGRHARRVARPKGSGVGLESAAEPGGRDPEQAPFRLVPLLRALLCGCSCGQRLARQGISVINKAGNGRDRHGGTSHTYDGLY